MILTVEQIQEKIKNPNQFLKAELERAVKDDSMCAMHTEIETDSSRITYLQTFLQWVSKMIVPEKLGVFEHLLTKPIKTVEITNGIMDELKKVFEAQDRYISFEFTSPELKDKFEELRAKVGELNYWQTKGFQLMKSAINSFVIIDLPAEQTTPTPQPYFYTISPKCVIETEKTLDNNLEYLIFRIGGYIWAFDDQHYRKFQDKTDEWTLLGESKHGLGYCPANTFWGTDYNSTSLIQKQNVIIKSAGWLHSLLASITMGEHLGWYAGFPVMIGLEHKCTYQDPLAQASCNGYGILEWMDQQGNAQRKACPQCTKARNSIYGPGSFHTAPAPASPDDPNLMDGFRIISPDTTGLEWIEKNKDARIAWLTYNLIGVPDEVTSMAINEKQVVSQFESRLNVLLETKDNFERIQKFVDDTLARLAFGPAFVGSTVKYGEKFFMHTASKLQEQYENAKSKGAAMYEVANYRHEIIQTKYKNNPFLKKRLLILSWLEPYPDMTVEGLQKIQISNDLIILKAGFDNFISRFEREFTDVVSFMQFAPLPTKMDFISQTLLGYVKEQEAEEEVTLAPPIDEPPTI